MHACLFVLVVRTNDGRRRATATTPDRLSDLSYSSILFTLEGKKAKNALRPTTRSTWTIDFQSKFSASLSESTL